MADTNQVDEAGLAEKQALKYAEDLATVYDSLRKSEKRYRALFEYSPVSLWEGELLELKNHIDGLKAKGIHDFKKYFDENPEEVFNSICMIKILDANRATLELYEAETKEEVIEVLKRCLREIPAEKVKTALISAAMGRSFEIECNHRTCTDKEITVMIKSTVPPGYEETWARVYSNGKKIKFISEKKLVKAIKRAFSSKEMDINKEGEKILAPFVKDKIRILKEEMLKKSTVAPKKNYWGTVVIKTPDDKKEMTIEVTLGDETHKINYNLISLK